MSATAIRMPKLGMTMEEGKVVAWQVVPGDPVEKGQIVLVIETEKTEAEIEATAAGVLRHVYVEAGGEAVPCGTLLAALTDDADEEFDPEAFAADRPRIERSDEVGSPRVAEPPRAKRSLAPQRPGGRPVSPAARAAARRLALEIDSIPGTGPGGRVTKQDVESFAAARENLAPVADGVALELLRDGEGEPVLLLPGFGSDVSCFSRLVPALARSHEVLGLNPRGVGHSDAPKSDAYDVATAAADAAAVLDGPTHVVGASLGAAVALELAASHGELVRSLTLITPFVEASPRLRAVTAAWTSVAESSSPETLARFLAPWIFSETLLADDVARERMLRGLSEAVKRIPASTLARQAAGLATWSAKDLGPLDLPTLVLVAEDDLLTPHGEALAGSIGKPHVEIVPGAGHALAIEGAEAVTAALLAHLRECDAA